MRPSEDTMAAARPERTPNTNNLANQAVRLQVGPHPSDFARSHAANWTPPAPITAERAAIATLKVGVCDSYQQSEC
jgi:hypothetical protein